MNKLSQRQYLQIICESLVKTYGNTLIESNTDLHMAEDILETLKTLLYFRPLKMLNEEWKSWRYKFILDNLNVSEEEAIKMVILPRKIIK